MNLQKTSQRSIYNLICHFAHGWSGVAVVLLFISDTSTPVWKLQRR